jgi:hypothetical protein
MAVCFARLSQLFLLVTVLLFTLPATSFAVPSLLGSNLDVTFDSPFFGFTDSQTETVGAGPEITPGDGSDIGDLDLATGEYVDIGASSITLGIAGLEHRRSSGLQPDRLGG